ncbi:hypothetical protein PPERSA_00230 [Pseudocohnilembus persalinus]|uniref:Inositol 1,4,5-trisphosphate/ryanodine receptor domain-containing protein n=1 Tax=Pseudocohnilembus persalinus TaxID=266149 RepID=A0A0V0Q8S0_PSEPJ|nr:hypothetical protein PPERSA_00230 [Pseudocohnilembus persalinus]|eukprot:KRW98642.1 hypothetical protein PPERSA_00230 [Pseudocohnilembus persalinus]
MATIDKKSNQNYKRKEFLHFGALITINCSDLPFQMASDGFIEKTISLKTTLNEQNNSQQQLFQQENNKNPVSPKKPHNKNELFNNYIDKQENFSPKKKANDYNNNMNNFDINSFEKSISNKPESAYNQKQNNKLIKNGLYDNIFRIVPTFPKINNLDKNATDKEIIENYDRQINERLKYLANTTVSYGQDFQLQHYKSHKFLCYSNNEKSLNQKGYQLQLKEQSDLTCHFEIRPCYNFQQEITNNIRFYDDVYIVSISKFTEKDAFISIQEDKESKQTLHQIFSQQEQKDTSSDSDIKESDEEEDSDSKTTSLKKQNIADDFDESESDLITSKKSENLKSPKKKFAFNLKQVTSVKEKNETFKKQKQLLKLSQKNYKAYRSQFQKSKFQMHLYRKYYDESGIYLGNCVWISFPQKDTYFTYDSLHKIVKLEKRMDREYNNSLGLFILEGQKQNDGGKVIFSQTKFKLKNLCNGKYVYVKNALSYKDLNMDFYNQALEEQSIIPDQENEEDYKNDMENFEDKNFSKIFGFTQQPKPSSYFIIQDMYQDYHKQKTVQQSNQEDALKFHKANSKEVWEEQILISCMKILNEGKIQLNKISSLLLEQKEKSDQYNKLINNIDIINQFEDESQGQQYQDKAHIYFRRQLILRQHGYFKYLTQILVACFPDEGVLKHIPERNPMKQLNKNQKQQKLNKLSHSLSQDNINTALLQAKCNQNQK